MDWLRIIDIFVVFGLAWILLRWSVADSINSTIEKEARSFLREIEFQRECVTNELRKIQNEIEQIIDSIQKLDRDTRKN